MVLRLRLRFFASVTLVSCALVALVGCGGSFSGAKSDFRKGRFAEAEKELVAMEPRSKNWSSEKRAEYSLYRGLVHHALGDRRAALLWLREAKAIDDAQPHTLAEDDRTRLDLALESLASDAAPPSP